MGNIGIRKTKHQTIFTASMKDFRSASRTKTTWPSWLKLTKDAPRRPSNCHGQKWSTESNAHEISRIFQVLSYLSSCKSHKLNAQGIVGDPHIRFISLLHDANQIPSIPSCHFMCSSRNSKGPASRCSHSCLCHRTHARYHALAWHLEVQQQTPGSSLRAAWLSSSSCRSSAGFPRGR